MAEQASQGHWFADKADDAVVAVETLLTGVRKPTAAEEARARDLLRYALIFADNGFNLAKTELRNDLVACMTVIGRSVPPHLRRAYWALSAARTTSRLAEPLEFDRLYEAFRTAMPRQKLDNEALKLMRRCRDIDNKCRKLGKRLDGFMIEEGC